jgi:hypothetical protein
MESDKPAIPQYIFERRRHPRFMVQLPVEYSRAGASRFRPGYTIDFSEDGFMIAVSEQMETGEDLEMKLYFASTSGLVTIAAVVKVIWADTDAKEAGYYRFGVRYADISTADKETLKAFLSMYADPNQAAVEMKPRAGSILNPSKLSAPEQRGRPLAAILAILAFLKGLLGYGRRAMGKGRGR